jgi:aerobic-type carbon monoxide dehydrogenase small subunit (CoxS/CutS family)
MQKDIAFTLNDRHVQIRVQATENAVDIMHHLGLFGPRESCGLGMCGCCTILVDGQVVSGCLTIASRLDGTIIETIEHLDADGHLHPVQQAFIDQGAFQCGFCTPGFVMMARQLLVENPNPSDEEIRDYLSGNLCRCAAYPEIVRAVRAAATQLASKAA